MPSNPVPAPRRPGDGGRVRSTGPGPAGFRTWLVVLAVTVGGGLAAFALGDVLRAVLAGGR